MLKFGLVGCGRISKRHSELLGYNQIDNASLVAVCDLDEEKAKNIDRSSSFADDSPKNKIFDAFLILSIRNEKSTLTIKKQ